MRIALVAVALLCAPAAAIADCERTQLPREGHPGFDGPGSFGPLQGTVTLGCLKYIGFLDVKGKRIAIIEDETGAKYRVGVGDWVGEDAGKVTRITPENVEIVQLVKGPDGKPHESQPKYLER